MYAYMYNGGCNISSAWNRGNGLSTGRECLNYVTSPASIPLPAALSAATTWSGWCQYRINWDQGDTTAPGTDPEPPGQQAGCVWAATVFAPAHPGGGTALVNSEGGPYTPPPAGSIPPAGHDAAWNLEYGYAYSTWDDGQSVQKESPTMGWGPGIKGATAWCAQAVNDDTPDSMAGCLAGVKAGGGA